MTYFSLEEMRCKSGAAYPAEYVRMGKWAKLQASLDRIREAWGNSLIISSGYREPALNAQLRETSIARLVASGRTQEQAECETGVAKDSKHMYGEAADIHPVDASQAQRLHSLIIGMVNAGHLGHIGGVGEYPRWVHVDIRERLAGGRLTTWG